MMMMMMFIENTGKRLEPTSKTSKAIVPLSLRLNLAT